VVIIGESNRLFTPGPPLSPGGPENSVPVLNFTFSASQGTGRTPTKGPIIVYREVDSTSPLLLTTLVSNNLLPEVKLVAVISNSPTSGTTGFYYSLQRARVTGLDTVAAQGPGQYVATTLGGTTGSNDTTVVVEGTQGQGTLIEKITFSWEGLNAYYFDGQSSKLATWPGTTAPKSSSAKSNQNGSAASTITDILNSLGIIREQS
jgi:type VI protein secretion system component Hcp